MFSTSSHPFNVYLRKLANLSSNNRCLFLPRLRSDHFVDLHDLSQLNGEPSFSLIEAALQQQRKIICAGVDSRMTPSNEASKKLRRLQRAHQLIYEERGVRDLYIGWPFVQGKFLSDSRVRCPLLLLPVELMLTNNAWAIHPRKDTVITFNKFFLLAYFFHNHVPIDEALLDETFEEVKKDSLVFRTKLYERLRESVIDLHFNADNYSNSLVPFSRFLKKEFDEVHEAGKLKLFPEAVLGLFPQSGSYLAPDYLALMNDPKITDIETLFLNKNTSPTPSLSQPLAEKNLFFGYHQDVWQENVLRALKQGSSLIAKGPPGTGKSQLICNIICDAVASRKKVLVVCQKRAALDVIYQRITSLQLTDFLAIVHDFKNDRKSIYAKAAKQIGRIEEYKTKNNSLNAIQLNRTFVQTCNRIDQITTTLTDLKKALFDESECGLNIKELYLRSSTSRPAIGLKSLYLTFSFNNVDTFLSKLNTYAHYAQRFEQEDYPWKERKSFASLSAADARKIEKILIAIPSLFTPLCDKLHRATGYSFNWQQCLLLSHKRDRLQKIVPVIAPEKEYRYFQKRLSRAEKGVGVAWLERAEQAVLACFEGEGPEMSLPSEKLIGIELAVKQGIQVQHRFVGYLQWFLFYKIRRLLRPILHNNGLHDNREGLSSLAKKLSKRIELERVFTALKKLPELTEVPTSYDKGLIKEWFIRQKHVAKAASLFWEISQDIKILAPHKMQQGDIRLCLATILNTTAAILEMEKRWKKYLTGNQIAMLTSDFEKCTLAHDTIHQDFDALRELDKLREGFSPDEKEVIKSLCSAVPSRKNLSEIFINSLALAWIDHIEEKYPVLNVVSSGKLTLLESELGTLIATRQKISTEIMLMSARDEVIENLQFNRLNNRVTYRDLLYQLTKKKKIWPIRKLLSQFEHEMFRVLPCWLASPESVSAIFPLKEMFDIVIFDEASQCFTERGIPAICRGRQVLIVGDDKQLKPNDLYQIRWQEEETDNPDLEVNSLLDLAERHLKQLPLKSHYRSKYPELIDFSNQHFYDGQLTCIPYFEDHLNATPPIVYHRVEGVWENNTNVMEANEAVALVVRLTRECPEKDIGIVTFNAPQQMLILDLLEDTFAQKKAGVPPSLIVKNIENMQGDEKDIIIFSVGYAPNKARKIRAQFGSLNIEGGENRLNVAVTRAREQVIVVTSIQPHQLQVEETQHEGPKLLKKYLHYAQDVAEGRFKPFVKPLGEKKSTLSLSNSIKSWGTKHSVKESIKNNLFSFSDLSTHNNDKICLLLTDDELYHKSLSAKDYHFSIPHMLRQKKWNYIHLYSRNYWQDRAGFFERIAHLIAEKNDTALI